MNFAEIQKNARENMNGNCKACRICNGEACRGIMPGPGGKATGDGFTRSYQKLQEVKVHMDTLYEEGPIDTSCEFFGHTFQYPFFAAPIAGVEMQYGPHLDSMRYNKMLIDACKNTGTLAFIYHHHMMTDTLVPAKESGGWAVPTVKPWPVDFMIRQFQQAEDATP